MRPGIRFLFTSSLILLAGTMMWAQGRPSGGARPGGRPGGYHGYRGGGAVAVPYPVIVGSPYGLGYAPNAYGYGYYPPTDSYYGDPNYASGYPADPNYGANYGANYGYAPQQPPVVVINPGFQPDVVNPVVRDYSNTPLPQPTIHTYQNDSHPYGDGPNTSGLADDQPTIFLIAKTDHTILPTIAYWVQGDTLSYVTVEGNLNHMSMSLVDRDFSKQLNDERHVPFKLPAAK